MSSHAPQGHETIEDDQLDIVVALFHYQLNVALCGGLEGGGHYLEIYTTTLYNADTVEAIVLYNIWCTVYMYCMMKDFVSEHVYCTLY